MEKLVCQSKKEIRMHLADALHQTIQTLGLSKASKKSEKLMKRVQKNWLPSWQANEKD